MATPTPEKMYYATGRRKTSTARVYLKPGTGKLTINGKKIDEYLNSTASQMIVQQPFDVIGLVGKFDARITVQGGGQSGQAGAIRLGISRALINYDATLRGALKKVGYLTRDSRMVERKKYGQSGARARFQYSKR